MQCRLMVSPSTATRRATILRILPSIPWISTWCEPFPITERIKFQFRAEAQNAFNILSYANPGATIATATLGNGEWSEQPAPGPVRRKDQLLIAPSPAKTATDLPQLVAIQKLHSLPGTEFLYDVFC
jgi:hypothetical protein